MPTPTTTFETAFETYTVTGVLGEGGAGRVYSVENSDRQSLALKCLHAAVITSRRRKRFKNEIDFCRKDRHSNIVRVVDYGLLPLAERGIPFYVMPLFPKTLRDLMREKIEPGRVLPLLAQVLDGVEAAHLLGVFHRDLKPENVLSESSGTRLVVADFGIAHFEEDLLATDMSTGVGERLANLRYSAPEQRSRGAKVDQRADIFALGLIMNEMFTGEVPQGSDYRLISEVAPEYAYLDAIVERMIKQMPEARISCIEEVKKELIARKNEFVARQMLDAKKREVVPVHVAEQTAPVRLTGVDWQAGKLILKLDRKPDGQWVARFQNPRENYSFSGGATPATFSFSGTTASVRAGEHEVQAIVNHFKQYLEMATRAHQADLDTKARQRETAERRKLEEQVAEAERRERILKSIKF